MVVENCEELGDEVQGGPFIEGAWGGTCRITRTGRSGKTEGTGPVRVGLKRERGGPEIRSGKTHREKRQEIARCRGTRAGRDREEEESRSQEKVEKAERAERRQRGRRLKRDKKSKNSGKN